MTGRRRPLPPKRLPLANRTAWGPNQFENRIVATLRLLALLPTAPGVTLAEMRSELNISQWALRRLLRALRVAGFSIGYEWLPQGVRGYYLPRQQQALIDKLLRA